MLNTSKVQQLIELKGLKVKWVIQQMGLKRTAGYYLLKDGLLPKDEELRRSALEKLANILGVEVPQILLRLSANRRTA